MRKSFFTHEVSYMKGKIMDIKTMIFFFAKDCRKSPKNSLKIVICACKWKFGSTTFHCSNSVMTIKSLLKKMKEEKRIFPFMYISLRKFMIMIANHYIEFRFRLFWDTLYMYTNLINSVKVFLLTFLIYTVYIMYNFIVICINTN